VVIYLENWSFDSLYGSFPGADGISQAGAAATQVDKGGKPYDRLPQPLDSTKPGHPPDQRFPSDLPNAPFDIARYVPPAGTTGDLLGRFYQEQQQIDGGKMDRFVAVTDAGGLPMGYYDATQLPLGELAAQYTLADHFFHAAYGGSMLNHFWLVCGCTPAWPGAPASMTAQLDGGNLMKDGAVTPDGFLVNTALPVNGPHPKVTDTATLAPAQSMPTIGDRLSEKGVDWAWYSGGWADALAGHPDRLFQFNHQPFAYFAGYGDGTPGRATHLKDESDLVAAVKANALPAVSFVKPIGHDNEHPGYASLLAGEQHAADLVKSIMASNMWDDTAIIVTYDENGGFWDHVAPPPGDRWGPGTRVPAIVIAPFAKRGFVDHTVYDTTSILALIEKRFDLKPLGDRDAKAAPLDAAFTFTR
jgi:phospholipase C